jgi:hypothetical protein
MFFTELLGPSLGQFVNILVGVHLLALGYWVWGTLNEQSKNSKREARLQGKYE